MRNRGAEEGRHARAHGHEAILLPPHAVRPYVQRNKTDRTDTLGLLEARHNEAIHPVPVKSVEQQALASLHSLRSTWVSQRGRCTVVSVADGVGPNTDEDQGEAAGDLRPGG